MIDAPENKPIPKASWNSKATCGHMSMSIYQRHYSSDSCHRDNGCDVITVRVLAGEFDMTRYLDRIKQQSLSLCRFRRYKESLTSAQIVPRYFLSIRDSSTCAFEAARMYSNVLLTFKVVVQPDASGDVPLLTFLDRDLTF